MSTAKAALRAAKAAIDEQRYDDAAAHAEKALVAEPRSYHANVFLGLALDKLNRQDDAVRAYHTAIGIKATEPLAWQGLVSLYERQGERKVDDYQQAVFHLAEIYKEANDQNKCQNVVEKLVSHVTNHGSRLQQRKTYALLLPPSKLWEYLEDHLPPPSDTYQKTAQILEAEEAEHINKEIGKRRTRLGAFISQVTREVKLEVWASSSLEETYQNIINWTRDDDIRREYEEKLLKRAYDTLAVLPLERKAEKRAQVHELAKGMVIIKHPYKLAWSIYLEWKDRESFTASELQDFRQYIDFFPQDGLANVLRGYIGSEISPITPFLREDTSSEATVEENTSNRDLNMSLEDRLLLMTDGIAESTHSLLAHRLMSEYYYFIEEFEAGVETSRKALTLAARLKEEIGLELILSSDSIRITLANCLIRYRAPRYFDEAQSLFDSVLERVPSSVPALVGKGHLLGEREDYHRALEFFRAALAHDSDNLMVKLEAAWYQALCGDYQSGLENLEACLSHVTGTDIRRRALRARTLYRIGVCLWELDASSAARKSRTGAYARFLGALQADSNFAPAYTSLGLYYADYVRDKKRARRCFLKAIELSASEILAAERLARGFADDGEWDLVELVAQRVVDSGKTRPETGSKGKKVTSWPYAALGIVQLNKQEFAKSIVSFQAALRIAPGDYNSWIGLGESYHNSGRYIAATKAFEQAQKVRGKASAKQSDSWFANFLSANVKRELGQFDDAVEEYTKVLTAQPKEFGVLVALVQTLVEGAWHNIELGFFGRASENARSAINHSSRLVELQANAFNLWKALADASIIFSFIIGHVEGFPWTQVQALLNTKDELIDYDILLKVDGVGRQSLSKEVIETSSAEYLERCIHGAILAQKRSLATTATDSHARALAWQNGTYKRSSGYLRASIQCFKRAIETEARNSDFWNALGMASSTINPKVSQHAFVRSLCLNDKSSRVWTNLGALCLLQGDYELANRIFSRAQATDPEYAPAWYGQGLIALLVGDSNEASLLFDHAFDIADGSLPVAGRQYVLSTFDQLAAGRAAASVTKLIQPLFALAQLRAQSGLEPATEYVAGLLHERAGDYAAAGESLASVCAAAEQEHEVSESAASLMHFALGKADMARTLLAAEDYAGAADSAETALQLAMDSDGGGGGGGGGEPRIEDPAVRRKCQLSARLAAGLAHYHAGDLDSALAMLRAAVVDVEGGGEGEGSSVDAECLLAQVMWATGAPQERKAAMERLLDCVGREGSHLPAALLLGAMALLDGDAETLDAVVDDLETTRENAELGDADRRRIQQLLVLVAALSTDDGEKENANEKGEGKSEDLEAPTGLRRAVSEAQISVALSPALPHGWSQLAALSGGVSAHPAQMALKTAQYAVPPRGVLVAEDLAEAFAATATAADAQCAVMIAPWLPAAWRALADAVSC